LIVHESVSPLKTDGTTITEKISFTVPYRQFADEMSRFIVQRFQSSELNGLSEVRIKLIPENLGHVDVHLKMLNGHLVAQFITDKVLGRDMLEGQLSQLRSALQSHGIQVEKLEVTHQSSQGGMTQEHNHQQSSKKPQAFHKDKNTSYEFFLDEFDEKEDFHHARQLLQGGYFDASA
jgi:flagellar hook-length control protein FliK